MAKNSTWTRQRVLQNIIIDKFGCWHINGGGINGGRPRYPHRKVWKLWYGPIPDGKWILHKCRNNHKCCNPGHLYLGDGGENQLDRYNVERHKPHYFCSNGGIIRVW